MKEGPFGARKPWEPSRMRLRGPVTVDDVLQSLVGRGPRIPSSTGTQLEIARARAVKDENGNRAKDNDRHKIGALFDDYAATPPRLPFRFDSEGIRIQERRDPWAAMDRAEQAIGRELGVTRCLDGLCSVKNLSTRWIGSLVSLHRKAPQRTQGELVVLALRAYHEWTEIKPGDPCGKAIDLGRTRRLRVRADNKRLKATAVLGPGVVVTDEERGLAGLYVWSCQVVGEGQDLDPIEVARGFHDGKNVAARKQASKLYSDALTALSAWVRTWNGKNPVDVLEYASPIPRTLAGEPKRASTDGNVYFVRDTVTGEIKIGYTTEPIRLRLGALQTGNPHKLELIGTRPGGSKLEGELHQRFAAQRLQGEWFTPSDELLKVAKGE